MELRRARTHRRPGLQPLPRHDEGGWGNPDHDDSIRIIHAALDAGINFVDTADVYSAGESDPPSRRDDVVLATTIEQLESQLPGGDVTLDAATLDRIDEIVRPGVNINPAGTSYGERVLAPALRRR